MVKEKKYVLVTGAASGIGHAITEYLATKGVHVFATDINQTLLDTFNDRENITPLYLDVTNIESIEKATQQISKLVNGLDGLINNAGLFVGGPLIEVPEKKVEMLFAVNIIGVYKVTKNLFPLLFKKKGTIINIGSEAGRFAFPLNGPYSMTKYALEAYSDSLRRELMFLNMKVIHLQLGAINTPLLDMTFCAYTDGVDINKTHFKPLLTKVIKVCENEKKRCAKPITVAKIVYKVLLKKHPRSRYKIKNNKARRLLDFLPSFLFDFALKYLFK